MSTSGITSNLLSSILDSSSTENKFATDLNQLAKDLKSGNLSAAKQDYVTLSSDMQSGAKATSTTTTDSGITTSELGNVAGNSSSESSFLTELNQLGTDLNNGNLTSSLQDMLSLTSTASNAPAATNSSSATSRADSAALIRAIVQAMAAGNSSAASYGLSQLASVSSNSSASSYLKTMAASLDSSSSSSSNSISQLLASANGSSSSSANLLSNLYGSSSGSTSSGLLSLLA